MSPASLICSTQFSAESKAIQGGGDRWVGRDRMIRHGLLNAPPAMQERYYSEKLGLSAEDGAGRRAVAEEYVRGLHWMLEYYYR